MDKILLSTYIIKIQDKDKNNQILNRFNGENDFLEIFNDYLNSIFENILNTSDNRQTTSIHLTLDEPPKLDKEKRVIYGHFSTGVSGEQYQITDVDSREEILAVQRNHAAFRNIFFYLKVPKEKNNGALILQRKAKFGIKTIFRKTVNQFFKEKGYQKYHILVNNVVHGKIYRKMMDNGNLKKVEFIKKRIPGSIVDYYKNDRKPDEIPGTLKTSMLSSTSLPANFKQLVDNLFTNPNRERVEIDGIDEDFDELEFELELNGKRKTFYVISRNRIQPNIDVTRDLEYDNEGNPTTESLIEQSEILIREVIELRL